MHLRSCRICPRGFSSAQSWALVLIFEHGMNTEDISHHTNFICIDVVTINLEYINKALGCVLALIFEHKKVYL